MKIIKFEFHFGPIQGAKVPAKFDIWYEAEDGDWKTPWRLEVLETKSVGFRTFKKPFGLLGGHLQTVKEGWKPLSALEPPLMVEDHPKPVEGARLHTFICEFDRTSIAVPKQNAVYRMTVRLVPIDLGPSNNMQFSLQNVDLE